MLNWAVDEEFLSVNPIRQIKTPSRQRRDVVYTPEQWAAIREHAGAEFGGLLDFLYATGCRPKEARILEARHVHNDLVIFPADESKGETVPRVIFLTGDMQALVRRLMKKRPTGCLFLNSKGRPWTKDAIKCRLNRIRDKVGFRVIAYGARHSYCTNALMNLVDPVSLAHLMGHKDTSMVSKTYNHLARNPAFLRQQAEKARSAESRSV